eukprot:13627990-Ditylum_brightwellii.AAC.1
MAMESQSLQGIAVRHSDNSDCMMVFCPFDQKFYHTNNYRVNESDHTSTSFNFVYDGGIDGMRIRLYLAYGGYLLNCDQNVPSRKL